MISQGRSCYTMCNNIQLYGSNRYFMLYQNLQLKDDIKVQKLALIHIMMSLKFDTEKTVTISLCKYCGKCKIEHVEVEQNDPYKLIKTI